MDALDRRSVGSRRSTVRPCRGADAQLLDRGAAQALEGYVPNPPDIEAAPRADRDVSQVGPLAAVA